MTSQCYLNLLSVTTVFVASYENVWFLRSCTVRMNCQDVSNFLCSVSARLMNRLIDREVDNWMWHQAKCPPLLSAGWEYGCSSPVPCLLRVSQLFTIKHFKPCCTDFQLWVPIPGTVCDSRISQKERVHRCFSQSLWHVSSPLFILHTNSVLASHMWECRTFSVTFWLRCLPQSCQDNLAFSILKQIIEPSMSSEHQHASPKHSNQGSVPKWV